MSDSLSDLVTNFAEQLGERLGSVSLPPISSEKVLTDTEWGKAVAQITNNRIVGQEVSKTVFQDIATKHKSACMDRPRITPFVLSLDGSGNLTFHVPDTDDKRIYAYSAIRHAEGLLKLSNLTTYTFEPRDSAIGQAISRKTWQRVDHYELAKRARYLFDFCAGFMSVLCIPLPQSESTRINSSLPKDTTLGGVLVLASPTVGAFSESFDKDACEILTDDVIKPSLYQVLHNLRSAPNGTENTLLNFSGLRPKTMIGDSEAMETVYDGIARVCATDLSVLLQGESGTGKELVAKAIHVFSNHERGRFRALNCAAIAETLLESELFGHERGAFTGAVTAKSGLIEQADGGTLFLDEVAEMSTLAQTKLLRVLETKEVTRLGSENSRDINFRLVCATNQDLKSAIESHKFRNDLYYRINGFKIDLPPLRTRSDDIGKLVDHFISVKSKEQDKTINGIEEGAMKQLKAYDWPGNVREMENAINYAVLMNQTGTIGAGDLPRDINSDSASSPDVKKTTPSTKPLSDCSKEEIEGALKQNNWNIRATAETFDVCSRTIYRWIDKFGLSRPAPDPKNQ